MQVRGRQLVAWSRRDHEGGVLCGSGVDMGRPCAQPVWWNPAWVEGQGRAWFCWGGKEPQEGGMEEMKREEEVEVNEEDGGEEGGSEVIMPSSLPAPQRVPVRVVVEEKDLVETFVRGSGKGGQKVNKTSNCVRLVHVPTGIAVRCHIHRSLDSNRKSARRLLKEALDVHLNESLSKKAQKESKKAAKARKAKSEKARKHRKKKEKKEREERERQMKLQEEDRDTKDSQ
eukprot:Nk52_evm7s247 gene=Nk52_evmTU7s247